MDPIREDPNLRFILKFCKAVGFWICNTHKNLYTTWTCISFAFTVLYIMALITRILMTLEINDLYINFCELAMLAKLANILRYRTRINNLLQRMHFDGDFQVDENRAGEVEIVRKQMKNYSNTAKTYFYMSMLAVFFGVTNGFGDPPRMAFNAWYPFGMNDMSVPWKFYAVFLFQGIPMFIHATINVCWDTLFIYVLTIVQLQFELLNHRLKEKYQIVRGPENQRNLKRVFNTFSAIVR